MSDEQGPQGPQIPRGSDGIEVVMPHPTPYTVHVEAHPAGLVMFEVDHAAGMGLYFFDPDFTKRIAALMVNEATKVKAAANGSKIVIPGTDTIADLDARRNGGRPS